MSFQTTVFGPIFGPIVSGFSAPSIGWRWAFWIAVIYAGVTFIVLFFLPETYGPVLLVRRARKLRRQAQSIDAYAPRELENNSIDQLLRKVLTRPLRMLFLEPIVAATCAYQALAYAIFYMSFQAFPIIFMHQYGLSPGVSGLCYLPIAAGAVLSMLSFWAWDGVVARAKARGAEWASREEYRRVPLATVGGPMFVVALFWLGFTSRPGQISFVVPMLSGLAFGMGFQLILMSLLNYLTDAYAIFAASANAAASTTRSLLAVVLPLATKVMFDRLGIAGACATLGGISAAMCIIPFIFLWKGHVLRERSSFCTALRKQLEAEERERQQRRVASGAKQASP